MPDLEPVKFEPQYGTEMGAMGAYTLLEHYPSENCDKYVGNHRVRARSGVFGHIGRVPNDAGGAIKPGLCKERLELSMSTSDEAYVAWLALESMIKSKLESLEIESIQDAVLGSERNDHSEGVWVGLLNSLVDRAEELYLMTPGIISALREASWSQLRRFYWHALDELVMSYVQTAQRKAKKLQKYLGAIESKRGPPPTGPAERRRTHKLRARYAICTTFGSASAYS